MGQQRRGGRSGAATTRRQEWGSNDEAAGVGNLAMVRSPISRLRLSFFFFMAFAGSDLPLLVSPALPDSMNLCLCLKRGWMDVVPAAQLSRTYAGLDRLQNYLHLLFGCKFGLCHDHILPPWRMNVRVLILVESSPSVCQISFHLGDLNLESTSKGLAVASKGRRWKCQGWGSFCRTTHLGVVHKSVIRIRAEMYTSTYIASPGATDPVQLYLTRTYNL